MKLWKIWQNEQRGYDTYDSAVVAADTADLAKTLHPDGRKKKRLGNFSVPYMGFDC
jgi:hypothetical protein